MKTCVLKRPFLFRDRKILLHDEVLFIPEYIMDFSSFTFPSWSEIFMNDQPIILEYCSGNGKWIVEKAQVKPHINWVAIEKKFDRVQKIWTSKKNLKLDNLFIICSEGNTFTTAYAEANTIDQVYINFPDPWPKTKHAKHRIMQAGFIKQLHRILRDQGKVIFTTDNHLYLKQSIALMQTSFVLDQLIENPQCFGDSYFSTLWQNMGRTIYYAEFSKQ